MLRIVLLYPFQIYNQRIRKISPLKDSRTKSFRMDTLIRENFVKNLEKKDAELALLQSQINPHFLYNTLDSINWLAIANDEDEISEMVTALSDMFRLSLTKSHSSYIRVAQEMEYVRSYLVLQQFRYEDCLSVSITIPDTVAELYIPRFTLQPLVENAIKHGMISPDDPFAIDLEIFIREHTLHIRIGNDGTRISLEQMKKLLDFDASRQELLDFDQKSYGVQNIQHTEHCSFSEFPLLWVLFMYIIFSVYFLLPAFLRNSERVSPVFRLKICEK